MKINRPGSIQGIEQIPGLDPVLRDLHDNLRSGPWDPPERLTWGTGQQDFLSQYQLVGRVCFIALHVGLSNLSLGASGTYLTLPIKAFRGITGATWYPISSPIDIHIYDHTAGIVAGYCQIDPNNYNKLIVPSYTPATSLRHITLSGRYWVE